jgi:hypothetical protein
MSPHGKKVNMETLLTTTTTTTTNNNNNYYYYYVALILDTEQLHNYIPWEHGLFQVCNSKYSA